MLETSKRYISVYEDLPPQYSDGTIRPSLAEFWPLNMLTNTSVPKIVDPGIFMAIKACISRVMALELVIIGILNVCQAYLQRLMELYRNMHQVMKLLHLDPFMTI